MADQGSPNWKDRAVSTWRQQGLASKLRELLDMDVDPSTVEITQAGSTAVVDGVRFTMVLPSGELEIETACPRCNKPQKTKPVESLTDVGKALDTLCRDCDFLVKSGLGDAGAAAPRKRGAVA